MHFLLYLTANDFVQDEFCYENQSFINLRLEQKKSALLGRQPIK